MSRRTVTHYVPRNGTRRAAPRSRRKSQDARFARIETAPAALHQHTAGEQVSVGVASLGEGRRWRKARSVVITAASCAVSGSAGYAAGGPALAIAGLLAVAVVGIVVAVILSAMLGRRDARSPFERLMLILCVITGRCPRDYLPPLTTQKRLADGSWPTLPTEAVVRVADELSSASCQGSRRECRRSSSPPPGGD